MSFQEVMSAIMQEMQLVAQALHRHGLLDEQSTMDASLSSAGSAQAWPGGAAVPVDQLPEAHRLIHASVTKGTGDPIIVLGVHTPATKAVAKLPQGFQPLAQGGVHFHNCVVNCDCLSSASSKLQETDNVRALMLGDEGLTYVIASSPGAAFAAAWYLEKSCKRLLLVGSRPTIEVDEQVWLHAYGQCKQESFSLGIEWPAVKASLSMPYAAKVIDERSIENVSEEEQALRVALIKAHRELNEKKLDELVWNHCSAKLGEIMLITPGDVLWDCVQPADLLIDSKKSANVTANILHSAVYNATSARAVVHTHAQALEAVSCIKGGLIEPVGSEFAGRVVYHDWEGISDDHNECHAIEAAISQVPNCNTLFARNHGAFTWGSSVEEAVKLHIALEEACEKQLLSC